MQHFSARINTRQGILHFYFNKIFTVSGIHYHISAIDKISRKAIMITMGFIGTGWIILNPESYPDWIIDIEKVLSNAIIENLADV